MTESLLWACDTEPRLDAPALRRAPIAGGLWGERAEEARSEREGVEGSRQRSPEAEPVQARGEGEREAGTARISANRGRAVVIGGDKLKRSLLINAREREDAVSSLRASEALGDEPARLVKDGEKFSCALLLKLTLKVVVPIEHRVHIDRARGAAVIWDLVPVVAALLWANDPVPAAVRYAAPLASSLTAEKIERAVVCGGLADRVEGERSDRLN